MMPSEPSASARIIVRGERVALNASVQAYPETGLAFRALPKRDETKHIVCHWTGAENPPDVAARNMAASKLSVHFMIDQEGTIYQLCDTDRRCDHAKGANDSTIGIEMINRGSGLTLPDKGHARTLLRERVHGTSVTYYGFTSAQIRASLALIEALCRAYALPMRVPLLGGEVYPSELGPYLGSPYFGVIGHLHVNKSKVDPGLSFLRSVHERGLVLDHSVSSALG